MRKVYGYAPDAPQPVADKAVIIIERHFAAAGVRRAEELPEESKVHLLRELQSLFSSELADMLRDKSGDLVYGGTPDAESGVTRAIASWVRRFLRTASGGG